MKDFYGVTGLQGDALFEKIYSFFGLYNRKDLGETAEH